MAEAWEEVDRNLAYWNSPEEGDVAVELWSGSSGESGVMPYTLLPLQGDWERLFSSSERWGDWIEALNSYGISPAVMRVSVYESGSWEQKVLWTGRDGGSVKWLS